MLLCIIYLIVVQFRFEFVEFKFELFESSFKNGKQLPFFFLLAQPNLSFSFLSRGPKLHRRPVFFFFLPAQSLSLPFFLFPTGRFPGLLPFPAQLSIPLFPSPLSLSVGRDPPVRAFPFPASSSDSNPSPATARLALAFLWAHTPRPRAAPINSAADHALTFNQNRSRRPCKP